MKNISLFLYVWLWWWHWQGVRLSGVAYLSGVLGAGSAGSGYEYNLKRQKDRVEGDLKAGRSIKRKARSARIRSLATHSFRGKLIGARAMNRIGKQGAFVGDSSDVSW